MQIITGEKKKYRYFIAPERGAWNTGAFLFCFRENIVFRFFYSFYNKKEINDVADPYDGE